MFELAVSASLRSFFSSMFFFFIYSPCALHTKNRNSYKYFSSYSHYKKPGRRGSCCVAVDVQNRTVWFIFGHFSVTFCMQPKRRKKELKRSTHTHTHTHTGWYSFLQKDRSLELWGVCQARDIETTKHRDDVLCGWLFYYLFHYGRGGVDSTHTSLGYFFRCEQSNI